MANAVGDAVGPGYSTNDSAWIGAGTGAEIRGDADGPERAESKIDIIMLDKTNKIPILISY